MAAATFLQAQASLSPPAPTEPPGSGPGPRSARALPPMGKGPENPGSPVRAGQKKHSRYEKHTGSTEKHTGSPARAQGSPVPAGQGADLAAAPPASQPAGPREAGRGRAASANPDWAKEGRGLTTPWGMMTVGLPGRPWAHREGVRPGPNPLPRQNGPLRGIDRRPTGGRRATLGSSGPGNLNPWSGVERISARTKRETSQLATHRETQREYSRS